MSAPDTPTLLTIQALRAPRAEFDALRGDFGELHEGMRERFGAVDKRLIAFEAAFGIVPAAGRAGAVPSHALSLPTQAGVTAELQRLEEEGAAAISRRLAPLARLGTRAAGPRSTDRLVGDDELQAGTEAITLARLQQKARSLNASEGDATSAAQKLQDHAPYLGANISLAYALQLIDGEREDNVSGSC
jgi:hypothetical protein